MALFEITDIGLTQHDSAQFATLGRVWAIDEMASLATTPLALLGVGLAQARIGDSSVLLLGAFGAIAVLLAVLAFLQFPLDEGARSG